MTDLMDGYSQIDQYSDRMGAGNDVSSVAKHIFKLAFEGGQIKGKPREAIIAGCLFIACRQTGNPRTFREIYSITNVSKKEIGRVFKNLESFLSKVGAQQENTARRGRDMIEYRQKGSTQAKELLSRYAGQLGFKDAYGIVKIAEMLTLKSSGVSEIAGRSPLSVAAACIYFVSHLMGDPKSSREIAGIAGVSDGTIKTAYRFMYNIRQQLVDPAWGGDLEKLPAN